MDARVLEGLLDLDELLGKTFVKPVKTFVKTKDRLFKRTGVYKLVLMPAFNGRIFLEYSPVEKNIRPLNSGLSASEAQV